MKTMIGFAVGIILLPVTLILRILSATIILVMRVTAVITGPLDDDNEETIIKVMCKEVHRPDLVILENVDYIHRTPMTILPTGALMEIDCDVPRIEILESGVS